MSLRPSLHAVMHLLTFRNIDITTSGLYQLHISLSCASSPLSPSNLTPGSDYKNKYNRSHNIGESQIGGEGYRSNAFLISYSDEDVRIGDVVRYAGDVEGKTGLECEELQIDMILLHCGEYSQGSALAGSYPANSDYSQVSKCTVKVSAPAIGFHELIEAVFSETHFSVVTFVLHVSAVNWDFQPALASGSEDEVITLQQHLFKSSEKHVSAPDLTHVFTQYLFPLLTSLQSVQSIVTSIEDRFSYIRIPYENHFADYQSMTTEQLFTQSFNGFKQFCGANSPEAVSDGLYQYIQSISICFASLITFFDRLSASQPEISSEFFTDLSEKRKNSLYSKAVVKDQKRVDSVPMIGEYSCEITTKSAEIRSLIGQTTLDQVYINDFPSLRCNTLPVLFEESYIGVEEGVDRRGVAMGGSYLYVLVSGYGGSSGDVRRLRNFIALNRGKNGLFLISRVNDGRTDASIEEMGAKLAEEVRAYIDLQCRQSLSRLSFIGHSLGGLIIRAALPLLSDFSEKMHAYVSLSTPHLGLMYSKSKLMKAGIWVLESIRRSTCLKQLKMKDQSALENTALYVLSGAEGLSWFRHVVLFSSGQDKYAPQDSARIQLSEAAQNGSEKGCWFVEMSSRILSSLEPASVRRVAVDFGIVEGSLKRMLGRKAHIEFIENRLFMVILCQQFPELFT